jgi:glutamate-5-semialdehyde dehydrogenase
MEMLEQIGQRAKEAARYAARLGANEKNAILLACANALEQRSDFILAENKKDMDAAHGITAAFADRLLLNERRIKDFADGMRGVAKQDDPVGETFNMKKFPNGLSIGQRRVPLGVVGIIYEARPNVTPDAFAICLKAGNSCILRGGTEAVHSNTAIVAIIQDALTAAGHPLYLVQIITDTSRETARAFMKLDKYVDVLIPRGGAVIKAAKENSTIPVIETGIGNCHIFVDESADLENAANIILNAKLQRPAVCNACEKLLIHRNIAQKFLPFIGEKLRENKVTIRGDEAVCAALPYAEIAEDADWTAEYLDLIIGVKIITDINEAITHINRYSSGHSDAILTNSYENSQRFVDEIDSAAVYVNASTRFTDGGEFGLGAEIGISTQKLHARGPMGVRELTGTKYIVLGNGQVRG